MPHQNLELLEITAERLRPLLHEIVFVGGCATGLLVTDPGAAPVRRTYDVDGFPALSARQPLNLEGCRAPCVSTIVWRRR
jgi:hypothetical protein